MMEAAGKYVALGWPVLLVHGIDEDGRCTCGRAGCEHPGKHPLTRHGFRDATLDLGRITRLLKRHPRANIGIATGEGSGESGLVVLDVDAGHGGNESLAALEAEFGPVPPNTPLVKTGDGMHLYFGHPGGRVRSRTISFGMDIKAEGGYVVAPPSRHASGRNYAWEMPPTGHVPMLPTWVIEDTVRPRDISPEDLVNGVERGRRNASLASKVGRWVARGLSRQEVMTLALGFAAACAPPMGDAEVVKTVDSILATHARNHPQAVHSVQVYSAAGPPNQAETRRLLVYGYQEFLRLDLPVPEEVIEGMIRTGEVGCIYGPSGTGKSLAALEACRAVASGGKLFAKVPCERGGATLVEQESSHAQLQQRICDLDIAHPLPKDAAALSIVPMQALTFDNQEARELLRAHIEEVRPSLLVVDTLVATIGKTDMNRAEQVRAWMNYFRLLASDFSLAVLMVAHSPKHADKEPKLESIFASVDFGASLDCAYAVSRVAGEADTFRLVATKERWRPDANKLDLTFAVKPNVRTLRFNNHDHMIPWGIELTFVGSAETVVRIVLAELEEGEWVAGKTVEAAVKAAGFSDRTARKALQKLAASGRVEERAGEGRGHPREYRLLGAEAR
jgi:archaellum biogenesis ATPase FlaH